MKKIFAIVLGVLAYTAAGKDGYTAIPDSEKPSLGAILSYGLQTLLNEAVADSDIPLSKGKFHVDKLNNFERQITSSAVNYYINALVSDNSDETQHAILDLTVTQSAKTGKFSITDTSVNIL